MQLFWEEVAIFELECNFWGIAVIVDGAFPSHRLYHSHNAITIQIGCSIKP